MIISHRHKFIFIKPQKTAGTSVELLLSKVCGPDDIITPLGYDPDPNVRKKHNAKSPQNYFRPKPLKNWELREGYWLLRRGIKPNNSYWEHLQADKIREYIGPKVWDNYLKISIVRNPWDHAVSWYNWQARFGYEGTEKGKFDQYLRNNYRSVWGFYSIKSIYAIDYMIRFEQLGEDLEKLSVHLPLNFKSIPVTKKSGTRSEFGYREYYVSQEQIDMVEERSLNVIKQFKYCF